MSEKHPEAETIEFILPHRLNDHNRHLCEDIKEAIEKSFKNGRFAEEIVMSHKYHVDLPDGQGPWMTVALGQSEDVEYDWIIDRDEVARILNKSFHSFGADLAWLDYLEKAVGHGIQLVSGVRIMWDSEEPEGLASVGAFWGNFTEGILFVSRPDGEADDEIRAKEIHEPGTDVREYVTLNDPHRSLYHVHQLETFPLPMVASARSKRYGNLDLTVMDFPEGMEVNDSAPIVDFAGVVDWAAELLGQVTSFEVFEILRKRFGEEEFASVYAFKGSDDESDNLGFVTKNLLIMIAKEGEYEER